MPVLHDIKPDRAGARPFAPKIGYNLNLFISKPRSLYHFIVLLTFTSVLLCTPRVAAAWPPDWLLDNSYLYKPPSFSPSYLDPTTSTPQPIQLAPTCSLLPPPSFSCAGHHRHNRAQQHQPHWLRFTVSELLVCDTTSPASPDQRLHDPSATMAGPAKKRAEAEKSAGGSSGSDPQKSSSRNTNGHETKGSGPHSVPRYDGNRDQSSVGSRRFPPAEYSNLRNLSDALGMMGWAVARGIELPDTLPKRPQKLNSLGREIKMYINTYNLKGLPTRPAYQYDITVGNEGAEVKRGLIKKVWASAPVKQAIGEKWLFDGNKLAWSSIKLERAETRVEVDLDNEEKRTVKPDKVGKNKHKIFIRFTKVIDFTALQAFLQGTGPWTETCIDTINFFDHVMREHPSQTLTSIKKNFFQRGEKRFALGKGIEAFKGVFSSIRPTLFVNGTRGLSVNVDVANGTFWISQKLGKALLDAFGCSTVAQLQQKFTQARAGDWDKSIFRRDLRRFSKLHVVDNHRKEKVTNWCIDRFIAQDCTEKKFELPDKTWVTIAEYFKRQYDITLTRGVPLVKMTKNDCYLPIDVLDIEPNQRYNSKLDEGQTSNMIKFAVTYPKERWGAVEAGVKLLDWPNDPYLDHYKVHIETTPVEVSARLLPCPDIQMLGGQIKAGAGPAKGRWRIDKMKFLTPNTQPLRAWGVCVVTGRGAPNPEVTKKFVQLLVTTYKGHGGKFGPGGEDPWIGPGNLSQGGDMITNAWQATGNKFQAKPQLLVWIVNDKNIDVYRRIKKSCDCRYGVVSQVLQSAQVVKLDSQYCSNVCMKVNAKLGGTTSKAVGLALSRVAPAFAKTPTMCVGADVSHPAPGGGVASPSFAAITVSQDRNFGKYTAGCDTNGHRVEMITTRNIDLHFKEQARYWIQNTGQGKVPLRILYIRDGVSEGQYQHVLEQEVKDMKNAMKELAPKDFDKVKFTVVIAGKRHHIRFFPKPGTGDLKTGNAMPGTLVETGCTHPYEWDFYLCSHAAIKGTARPIHYQVILNEGGWKSEELQQFLFEQSFQYMRSTTPVSLFPAVYYAHLAADRARAHENTTPVSSGKKEVQEGSQVGTETSSTSNKPHTEVNPLIAMNTSLGIQNVMWYI